MKAIVKKCSKSFASSILDSRNYKAKWESVMHNISMLQPSDLPFSHTQSNSLVKFFGQYENYPSGGYIASLSETFLAATAVISNLTVNEWIDVYTRAVFVEFGVLNVNENFFSFVTIVFEILITGDVGYTKEIESIQLYRYIGGSGIFFHIISA